MVVLPAVQFNRALSGARATYKHLLSPSSGHQIHLSGLHPAGKTALSPSVKFSELGNRVIFQNHPSSANAYSAKVNYRSLTQF